MHSQFTKVLLLGSSKVACECLKEIYDASDDYEIYVLETKNPNVSILSNVCCYRGIPYNRLIDKRAITVYLEKQTATGSCLIISADNFYIFQKELINKDNVEIINFHYSILPSYRGINIPSWVIYNNEKETGITWHYVTEEIDKGRILGQEHIVVNDDSTAFDIVRKGMALSSVCFKKFYRNLLSGCAESREVNYKDHEDVYLAKNLPNDGMIEISQPIDLIDRTLRAFDYQGMGLMPKLKIKVEEIFNVSDYKITRNPASYHKETMASSEGKTILHSEHETIEIWYE